MSISSSFRSRRAAGDPVYIYLTPLEESSGPWDEIWTPSPSGCSRRCGGGVLAETRNVPTKMRNDYDTCSILNIVHLRISGLAKIPTRRHARARPRGIPPATCNRAREAIRTRTRGRRSALGERSHIQDLSHEVAYRAVPRLCECCVNVKLRHVKW